MPTSDDYGGIEEYTNGLFRDGFSGCIHFLSSYNYEESGNGDGSNEEAERLGLFTLGYLNGVTSQLYSWSVIKNGEFFSSQTY